MGISDYKQTRLRLRLKVLAAVNIFLLYKYMLCVFSA